MYVVSLLLKGWQAHAWNLENDLCQKVCVIASQCCKEASGGVISMGTSQIMIAVPGAADSMAIKHDTSMGQGESNLFASITF